MYIINTLDKKKIIIIINTNTAIARFILRWVHRCYRRSNILLLKCLHTNVSHTAKSWTTLSRTLQPSTQILIDIHKSKFKCSRVNYLQLLLSIKSFIYQNAYWVITVYWTVFQYHKMNYNSVSKSQYCWLQVQCIWIQITYTKKWNIVLICVIHQ